MVNELTRRLGVSDLGSSTQQAQTVGHNKLLTVGALLQYNRVCYVAECFQRDVIEMTIVTAFV